METVLIVIHLMVVIALVIVVLLQRSEGGALGMGGGGGGGGGFMSARGAANALTRTTSILAAAFFATSIGLGIYAKVRENPADILNRVPTQIQDGGTILDQITPQSELPATDGEPSVPSDQ
ncbi:MAG: preprotein translocase subunit SecG [Salaquimonas sp.]